jgi:hypothetical protein
VPTTKHKWPFQALGVLVPILGLLLVIQYLAGLWTNAYAPANGFTSNTAYTALNLHYLVGFILGVLVLLVVAVAAFTRRAGFLGLAVVAAVSVWVAGIAGQMFVGTTPNNPTYSVSMGVAFLIAFWATLMLGTLLMVHRWRMAEVLRAAATSST